MAGAPRARRGGACGMHPMAIRIMPACCMILIIPNTSRSRSKFRILRTVHVPGRVRPYEYRTRKADLLLTMLLTGKFFKVQIVYLLPDS